MREIDSWDNPNVKDRIVTKEMKMPKPQKTIKWFNEEEIRNLLNSIQEDCVEPNCLDMEDMYCVIEKKFKELLGEIRK